MQLAKVVGNVVSQCAHKSVRGNALFICQPINANGEDDGDPIVAISPFGGGMGSKVVVTSDGSATRGYVKDSKSPLRYSIISIIDE